MLTTSGFLSQLPPAIAAFSGGLSAAVWLLLKKVQVLGRRATRWLWLLYRRLEGRLAALIADLLLNLFAARTLLVTAGLGAAFAFWHMWTTFIVYVLLLLSALLFYSDPEDQAKQEARAAYLRYRAWLTPKMKWALRLAVGLTSAYASFVFFVTDTGPELDCHGPSVACFFFNTAFAREGKDDYEGACQALSQVVRLRPKDARVLWFRAGARKQLGDLGGAIEDLTGAVHLAPSEPAYLLSRASLFELTGDWRAAIRDYDQVLSVSPSKWTYLYRSIARYRNQDLPGARRDYSEFLRLPDPLEGCLSHCPAPPTVPDHIAALILKP